MSEYLSQQELVNAIYGAVYCGGRPLSRLEICRAIGKKKSPHIINMIVRLRDDGWLIEHVAKARNGVGVLVYTAGRTPSIDTTA
jgi:hypothetical protein